jgi:hypothetical protein
VSTSEALYALDNYYLPIGGSWQVSPTVYTSAADGYFDAHCASTSRAAALAAMRRRIDYHRGMGRLIIKKGSAFVVFDGPRMMAMVRVRRMTGRDIVPMRWHHLVERVVSLDFLYRESARNDHV